MVTWHRFNQDKDVEKIDEECWRWTSVMPGDVVQSNGTFAYKRRDFIGRDENTKGLILRSVPILVLSRHEGIPGENLPDDTGRSSACHATASSSWSSM